MGKKKQLKVIVPEQKGIDALAVVPGIKAVLVASKQPIPESAQDAEILVAGPAEQQNEVDAALEQIKQLPDLKLLQTLGQGTEQWDDTLSSGIRISTARGAHGGSTAEWVMMALLALIRDLPNYLANQRQHEWDGHRTQTLLDAKVLIYGASDLGQNVQKRLQPFGAHITMVGTHSRDGVIDTATARTLLPTADAVIMALPLTADTKHIVDADFLAQLRDGTIIINAGRGGLIDQAALLAELQKGRLQAALDVMTPEPLPADDPLWNAPGLLLTPHIGGNTDGADDRAWQVVSEQIQRYLHGDLPT